MNLKPMRRIAKPRDMPGIGNGFFTEDNIGMIVTGPKDAMVLARWLEDWAQYLVRQQKIEDIKAAEKKELEDLNVDCGLELEECQRAACTKTFRSRRGMFCSNRCAGIVCRGKQKGLFPR